MAWEATHLLPLVLLVLLASGSWEQQLELLRKLEGETISLTCSYQPWQGLKIKAWCRKPSAHFCTILVTNPRLPTVPRESRNFIKDDRRLGYFTVTMTELRVKDSGFYWCGIYESSVISVLRSIHLVVSQASTLPTTRSARRNTAWTSATSPVINSPTGHWDIISSVIVAFLLLLVFTMLVALYLRTARGRGRTETGKDKSHHTYDIFTHKDETTVRRKDPSPGQRESQLSWSSDQQMGSGKDTEDIHYASLTHRNHFGPEDSIYVNTYPNPKPIHDPFLSVEYAAITKNRPQPSKSAALEEEPRI